MTLRLGGLARRIAVPRALLPIRGGGGGPLKPAQVPNEPLLEEDELTWNDGTGNPEPCVDDFPLMNSTQAAGATLSLLTFFGALGIAAYFYDKPSRQPFAEKTFPYDNLKVELGGKAAL